METRYRVLSCSVGETLQNVCLACTSPHGAARRAASPLDDAFTLGSFFLSPLALLFERVTGAALAMRQRRLLLECHRLAVPTSLAPPRHTCTQCCRLISWKITPSLLLLSIRLLLLMMMPLLGGGGGARPGYMGAGLSSHHGHRSKDRGKKRKNGAGANRGERLLGMIDDDTVLFVLFCARHRALTFVLKVLTLLVRIDHVRCALHGCWPVSPHGRSMDSRKIVGRCLFSDTREMKSGSREAEMRI